MTSPVHVRGRVTSHRSLHRAFLGLGALQGLSRGLGFGRDVVLAHVLPLETLDAFSLIFRFPNWFRRLVQDGSLALSVMDLLGRFSTRSWLLVNSLMGLVAAAVWGGLEAHWMGSHEALFGAGAVFLCSLFIQLGIVCILNTRGHLWVAAVGVIVWNCAVAIGVVVTGALGLAVLLATAAQTLLLATALFVGRAPPGRAPAPPMAISGGGVTEGAALPCAWTALSGRMVTGAAAMGLGPLFAILFLRLWPQEGLAAVWMWAERLVELPVSLIGASSALVLRSHQEKGRWGQLMGHESEPLAWAWAASLGLTWVGSGLIEGVFLTSASLTPELRVMIFWCVAALASGVVPAVALRLVVGHLIARGLWRPFVYGVLTTGILYLVCGIGLQRLGATWKVALGLTALASSASALWAVHLVGGWGMLRSSFLQALPALVVMAMGVWGGVVMGAPWWLQALVGAAAFLGTRFVAWGRGGVPPSLCL